MSNASSQPDEDPLRTLYELREELKVIAGSDVPYSEDAERFLESLREAGYDV